MLTKFLAAKKELLMRARYDALATSGGKSAVKKSIEKKQRKITQKEKRLRPLPKERGPEGQERVPTKRLHNWHSQEGGYKRRKLG